MLDSILQLSIFEISLIVLSPVLIWSTLVVHNYVKTREFKLFGYEFTITRYILFMTALSIPFILFILLTQSYLLFLFFLLAGIGGVIGEVLLSLWWRQFFWKDFWDYKHAAILRGDTSLLNFPAWGIGGMLVLFTFNVFNEWGALNLMDFGNTQMMLSFLLKALIYICLGAFISIILGRLILKKNFMGKTLLRYLLFASGIVIFIVLMGYSFGFIWSILAIIWGVMCFVTEYLFGKSSVKFLGNKLWLYTYITIDNDHTSILNILPFALGGFYFFSIYIITQIIILNI